jgi:hypothetical protein
MCAYTPDPYFDADGFGASTTAGSAGFAVVDGASAGAAGFSVEGAGVTGAGVSGAGAAGGGVAGAGVAAGVSAGGADGCGPPHPAAVNASAPMTPRIHLFIATPSDVGHARARRGQRQRAHGKRLTVNG